MNGILPVFGSDTMISVYVSVRIPFSLIKHVPVLYFVSYTSETINYITIMLRTPCHCRAIFLTAKQYMDYRIARVG